MNAVDAASGACDGLYSGPVFAAPATVRATQCQRAQTQSVGLAAEWFAERRFHLTTATNIFCFNTALSVQAIEGTDNSKTEQMRLDESVSCRGWLYQPLPSLFSLTPPLWQHHKVFSHRKASRKFPDWRLLTYLLSAERHPLWL